MSTFSDQVTIAPSLQNSCTKTIDGHTKISCLESWLWTGYVKLHQMMMMMNCPIAETCWKGLQNAQDSASPHNSPSLHLQSLSRSGFFRSIKSAETFRLPLFVVSREWAKPVRCSMTLNSLACLMYPGSCEHNSSKIAAAFSLFRGSS